MNAARTEKRKWVRITVENLDRNRDERASVGQMRGMEVLR
jgi:hypothetical protein